jgi:hypothetical protein
MSSEVGLVSPDYRRLPRARHDYSAKNCLTSKEDSFGSSNRAPSRAVAVWLPIEWPTMAILSRSSRSNGCGTVASISSRCRRKLRERGARTPSGTNRHCSPPRRVFVASGVPRHQARARRPPALRQRPLRRRRRCWTTSAHGVGDCWSFRRKRRSGTHQPGGQGSRPAGALGCGAEKFVDEKLDAVGVESRAEPAAAAECG